MEHLDITGTRIVQPILQRNVVDERIILLHIVARRYFSADNHPEAVVPEPFGKLEVIVGTAAAILLLVGLHSKIDINGLQGTAGNVVDLSLQE